MGRNIVLVGMMGAGKSAVGAELGRRLGLPVRDSDHEIEAAAAMTITEIFARDGEAFFRDRETQVLARLLGDGQAVVPTGGGAWMRPQNRALIAAAGVSVWLDCPLEALWQRVRQKPTRPLLQNPDPLGTLTRLHHERAPVYALADIRIAVEPRDSVEATATRIIDRLNAERPEILRKP